MRYILECLVLEAECDRHDFQHMYPHLFAWKYIGPITDGTVYHRWYCIPQMVLYTTDGTVYHRWYCIPQMVLYTTDGTVYHRWQYTEKRRGPKCMTHPFIVIYILHGLRQVVVIVVGNCNWM